jgi:hypothetical protein
MARGNKKEILEKLSALKTSTPTKTRSSSFKKAKKENLGGKSLRQDTVSPNEYRDFNGLVLENISAVNRITYIMLEEIENFHLAVINNWHRLTFVLLDLMKVNFTYFINTGSRRKKSGTFPSLN